MPGLLTLVLAHLPTAAAFCGTYVGPAGAELYNHVSQVAIGRDGTQTTLTLANDAEGDLSSFALVVPVPQGLTQDDVDVVEDGLFTRLDEYSTPRLVRYECEDFDYYDHLALADAAGGGDGSGGTDEPDVDGVSVQAEFSAGEYDIVVLDATGSEGLLSWLNEHGYEVPGQASDVLQSYIEAGNQFLAARVDLPELSPTHANLRPLQLRYESDALTLPLRLGTVNSAGVQDLLLYVVSDGDSGRVGIANYPEVEVQDECMIELGLLQEHRDFGEFWQESFDEARQGHDRAAWIEEYSWSPAKCDPCSAAPLTDEEVRAVGFEGEATEAFFTRLHLRFTPSQIDQDLSFYRSGDTASSQVRFIEYDRYLEEHFPVCGVGWTPAPRTCDEEPEVRARLGCEVPLRPSWSVVMWVLGLLSIRRRGRGTLGSGRARGPGRPPALG